MVFKVVRSIMHHVCDVCGTSYLWEQACASRPPSRTRSPPLPQCDQPLNYCTAPYKRAMSDWRGWRAGLSSLSE